MRLLSLLVPVLLAAALLAAGCDEDDEQPTAGTATATAESMPPAVTATATPKGRPPAGATAASPERPALPQPDLKRFAAGEVIDVAPAVVFVERDTGSADA